LDRLKHIFILLILVLNSVQLSFAQNHATSNSDITILKSNPEKIFVHCNATTFVSGETLYFKVYCLNPVKNNLDNVSKITYVELTDEENQRIFLQKQFLENGQGQGDFFIPTNLKTGNYKLSAYTNWMLNGLNEEGLQVNITIINPYETSGSFVGRTTEKIPVEVIENLTITKSKSADISLEKDNYSLVVNQRKASIREKIDLRIKSISPNIEKGNYSLSIRKIDSLPSQKQITAKEYKKTWSNSLNNAVYSSQMLILPELRGEMITGSIVSKRGTDVLLNKTIALSIVGKNFAFKITNTNAVGKFIFNLEKAYYGSNLVLQVFGEDRNNYTIKLDEHKGVSYSIKSVQATLELSADLKNDILQRSIAAQIQNAYFNKKLDRTVNMNSDDAFFKSAGREYILDDYKRFPSLEESITEELHEIYFSKSKGKYTIGVRDFSSTVMALGPPLVLIDGLLLQEYDELFEYSTNNIEKISIVKGGYFYGSQLFNGIISFTTKNQDFVSKQSGSYLLNTFVLRPSIKKEYFNPDYSDKIKFERIPDYRYQLLWLPQLTLDRKENLISFYTSDVTGTFEISLEGFTDQGVPVSLKDTFEVQ